jgi:hypothetical protein
MNSQNKQIPCSNPISCLIDGVTGPCIFTKLYLQECNTECLNRTNCTAFTMKIVEPVNTFISLTNLFVAQTAPIT